MADRPWLRLTRAENEQRIAAARVVAAQRRDPGLSLHRAAAWEGLTPDIVLRYFGRWYRADPTGSLQPLPYDREPFLMNVYSTRGVVEVEAADSDARSLIGQHTSAVWRYRDTGDTHQLDPFHGQRVAGVTLETDPDRLLRLLMSGPDFLDIYQPL